MPFPGDPIKRLKSNIIPKNPPATDLINSLHRLPMYGEHFCFNNFGLIPGSYYTLVIWNKASRVTHFQGVIRIPKTNIFYISGADYKNEYGQLFIGEINHHIVKADKKNQGKVKRGPVGSNMTMDDAPGPNDLLIKVFKFKEKGFFHAGGMDLEGSILAVPLEHSDGRSRIKFVNIYNPTEPEIFPASVNILRSKATGKAGAVALTRLKNKKYLCLVWSDSDDLEPRMDFYLSKDTDINNGFKTGGGYNTFSISWKEIIQHPKKLVKYQNLQFHQDSKGQIFLFGTENTAKLAPVKGGVNRAHLMMLSIDVNPPSGSLLSTISVTYIQERRFNKEQYPYNFKAGASFYINERKELVLYTVAHYRDKKRSLISLGEFYRPLEAKKKEVIHNDFTALEFYEDPNSGFVAKRGALPLQKKRCLKLYGKACYKVDDLKEIRVQANRKRGFDNKISSIRGVIPKGQTLNLWTDRDQQGTRLSIRGTGFYFEEHNLKDKYDMDNKICSIEIV